MQELKKLILTLKMIWSFVQVILWIEVWRILNVFLCWISLGFTVRGNHEEMCIRSPHDRKIKDIHARNGGEWFYQLSSRKQSEISSRFQQLPLVIEVQLGHKRLVWYTQILIFTIGMLLSKTLCKVTTKYQV